MNPPGPRLEKGSLIQNIRLGFRRLVCEGDLIYVQYENQRYFGQVKTVELEQHTTRHGRRVRRSILSVETRTA